MNSKQLREKRAKLVADARAILEKASTEKRDLTSEERAQYDTIFAASEEAKGDIERVERAEAAEKDLAVRRDVSNPDINAGTRDKKPGDEEKRSAFTRFLRVGLPGLNATEMRALQSDIDTDGGYLVPPMQFVTELLMMVDDAVYIRQKATKNTVINADSLGVPSLDTDISDADWTSELGTGNEDTSMKFGRRELHPKPLAKRIKISNKLLRQSPRVEALVRERLAYKFALTEEKAFLTGNGAGQPLGIFTASALGISTGRDVSTGSTTSITGDGLLDAKYALKGQYHGKAEWLFHRDAVKQVAKLKDGSGQYIWQPGLQAGQPDRLLNLPLNMSEYVPNTFTTGLYVGMLGDYSFYWIADALSMQVQRLVELYAETNQTGFIGRLECDGMPVLEEAFVRIKLA